MATVKLACAMVSCLIESGKEKGEVAAPLGVGKATLLRALNSGIILMKDNDR